MNLVVIPAEVLINWSIYEASKYYIDSKYDIRLFFEFLGCVGIPSPLNSFAWYSSKYMFSSVWFVVLIRPWNMSSKSHVLSMSRGDKEVATPSPSKKENETKTNEWGLGVNLFWYPFRKHSKGQSGEDIQNEASTPPYSKSFPIPPCWI